MATPHIAGVAALMLSINPALTPDQVESLLKSTARAFPQPCSGCGAGIVDANAAVQAALNIPATPSLPVDPYVVLKTDLTTNLNLWREQNILNYSYVLEQQTGTSTALRWKLTVKAGVVVAGVNLANNKTVSSRDLKSKGKTIEQLFTSIDSAIAARYAVINVNYDAALGYPLAVFTDKKTTVKGDETTLKASSMINL